MAGLLQIERASLRQALAVAVVSLLVALIDPFGLDAASDHRSVQAVSRILAVGYGGSDPLGRSALTTVSIDETSLRESAREWPPQYGFYAEALKNIAGQQARPAAIFLDYTFLSDLYNERERDQLVDTIAELTNVKGWPKEGGCTQTPLAKIACIHKAGGVPVIVGKSYPSDRCEATPTLVMLDRVAVLAPVGWPNLPEAWTPVITKAQYKADREPERPCQAVDGIRGADGRLATLSLRGVDHRYAGVASFDLTPAAAMATALCLDGRLSRIAALAACRAIREGRLPEEWMRSDAAMVLWGSRPDPRWLNQEEADYRSAGDQKRIASCRLEGAPGLAGVGQWIKVAAIQFFARFSDGDAAAQVPCPYHPDFRYERLEPDAPSYDATAAAKIRGDFIDRRVVVIGSTLRYGGDWISTVTRGTTPGMALHAMMFDNLIEQPTLLRDPPVLLKGPGFDLDAGEIVEILAAFLFAFIVGEASIRSRNRSPARRGIVLILLSIGALGVFVALATALVQGARWTPVNVQALWAIIVLQTIVAFNDVFRHFAVEGWRRLHPLLAPPPRPKPPENPAQEP